ASGKCGRTSDGHRGFQNEAGRNEYRPPSARRTYALTLIRRTALVECAKCVWLFTRRALKSVPVSLESRTASRTGIRNWPNEPLRSLAPCSASSTISPLEDSGAPYAATGHAVAHQYLAGPHARSGR